MSTYISVHNATSDQYEALPFKEESAEPEPGIHRWKILVLGDVEITVFAPYPEVTS